MEDTKSKFEPSRINRVNFMFLWGICIVLSTEHLILQGKSGMNIVIALVIAGIIGIVIFFFQ